VEEIIRGSNKKKEKWQRKEYWIYLHIAI
jgi:hypothetical protein